MTGLYEADILEWSERQGRLLRNLAEGGAPNESPDWTNIIEEIEDVGRSQLKAVKSLLVQALLHDLKCKAWPQTPYLSDWQAEARGFRDDAADRLTSSMRQQIDPPELYARALNRMPADIDGQLPLPVPAECNVLLDEVIQPSGQQP